MVQAGFIILTVAMAVIVFAMASPIADHLYLDKNKQVKFKRGLALFLAAWVVYVGGISLTGVFKNPAFPPRIPLLLGLPVFGSLTWFFTRPAAKLFIHATPASRPVYLQSFRIIVEILIYGCVVNGVLPRAASFAGYNFDIIAGITAPLVAYFMLREGKRYFGLVLVWNILGLATLAVVVFILMTHAYIYSWRGEAVSILDKGFGLFPYTYLAGFLMPLAVFLHIFSIIKIRQLMK